MTVTLETPPPLSSQGSFRHAQTGNSVSREELMMVLVGLESLQIRALHSQSAHSVSLRGAVLEGAESLPAGRHANNVEICMCPANYLGDSCQVSEPAGDSVDFLLLDLQFYVQKHDNVFKKFVSQESYKTSLT